MAEGPPQYPTPGEIIDAAHRVIDAAVKMRGEVKLRYVPQGHNPWRSIAGKPFDDYPDQAGTYGGFAVGPDGNYVGTDADWAKLRSQYTWIPDPFVRRLDPDPVLFQPLIDGMEQTALTIFDNPDHLASSPVAQYIRDASGKIDNWKGEAAETFQANFMNKLEIAAQNQAFIAGAMMHAMIAERDIFVTVRHDLLNVANQAVSAIEASNNKDPGGIKTALTVVAAVTGLLAGVASIPISGGLLVPASIQATLWIISGFSSTMGLGVPSGDSQGSPLSASSVDGVLSKMVDAIIRIESYIDSHERDVVTSLNSCYSTLTGPERSILLLPPEPTLVQEPDSQIRSDFLPP